MLPSARRTEPPRDCRRPFGLSYAAMATSSSMARPAAATSLVPMAALAEPVQALRDTWSTSAPEAAPDNGFVTTSILIYWLMMTGWARATLRQGGSGGLRVAPLTLVGVSTRLRQIGRADV